MKIETGLWGAREKMHWDSNIHLEPSLNHWAKYFDEIVIIYFSSKVLDCHSGSGDFCNEATITSWWFHTGWVKKQHKFHSGSYNMGQKAFNVLLQKQNTVILFSLY